MRSARDQLTALGPFFAADAHDPRVPAEAPWREMSELLDDPAVLAARIDASRAYLAAASGQDVGAVELRVAASVTHLGLVARTLSPLLALSALHGRTSAVGLRDLRWQPALPSTFPLSIANLHADTASAESVIDSVAADLCAITRPFGVSGRVLWGNVASAIYGAGTALSRARPQHAPRVQAVVTQLLRHPALDDAGQTSLDGRFQRRSCCLIYRAAPGRDGVVCGDCVLLGVRGVRRFSPPTVPSGTDTRP